MRFRIALAGRALRVSMFEMTGFEMIGRVPSEKCPKRVRPGPEATEMAQKRPKMARKRSEMARKRPKTRKSSGSFIAHPCVYELHAVGQEV